MCPVLGTNEIYRKHAAANKEATVLWLELRAWEKGGPRAETGGRWIEYSAQLGILLLDEGKREDGVPDESGRQEQPRNLGPGRT